MTVRTIYRLQDAFECDLAATNNGWAMAAVTMDDVDEGFIANMDADREWEDIKAMLLPGVTYQDWIDAYLDMRPTLHLVESRAGDVRTLHTSTAEQYSGFAVAPGPAFVWTELDGDIWSLRLHRDGQTSTLESGTTVLQDPSIIRDDEGALWTTWVSRGDDGDVVHVTDEVGGVDVQLPGRHPTLAAATGGIALCFERFQDGESHVYYSKLSQGSVSDPVRLSHRNPLNFLPRCTSEDDGSVLVLWESSPGWGYDIQVDQIREIDLRRIDPVSGEVSNGPGTDDSDGVIPIPQKSYERPQSQVHAGENRMINMTPSNAKLVRVGGDLVCTFRMVHPVRTRPYVEPDWMVDGAFADPLPNWDSDLIRDGWELCQTRWDGETWSDPTRISDAVSFSHHSYGAGADSDGLLLAVHSFDGDKFPERDHRVEVMSVTDGSGVAMHTGVDTHGHQEIHTANPPAQLPDLADEIAGYRLVFGDLHVHTSHSSCMPALDGSPPDNIRLQRDVLDYKAVSLADHHRISAADYRQRQDLLEREHAGGYVPLYGLEWNKRPWQHINFFTYDKQVMKELREVLHRDLDLQLLFDDIIDRFGEGKVTAVRHWHDKRDAHTYLYDPRVEWGMEVICGRGDRLASEPEMWGGITKFPFPVNFIEWRDAKLGMVGASDHHMTLLGSSLTGFWVKEVTGEGIFEAMRNQRTVACANGKMSIWIESNGVGLGEVGEGKSPVEIEVRAVSALPIGTVSLWGDGRWMEHRRADDGQTQFRFVDRDAGPGKHYYFARVETQQQSNFEKGPIIGYSSPIWVTLG